MKTIIRIFILALSLMTVNAWAVVADPPVLSDGRWYNDEFSIDISADGTYKSYYTFGGKSGSMKGSVEFQKGRDWFILKKGTVSGAYDLSFMSGSEVKFFVVEDLANAKSTRYLKNESGSFKLWNKNYMVKEDREADIDGMPAVTMGYKLSATTANLRIRKGPGKEYENMQFYFKDKKTGRIKSWGSILEGTNIRILARTKEKMQVDKWNNYWYYIEYKEPEGTLMSYKNAWCFAEFVKGSERSDRNITISTPENEASIYDEYSVVFRGKVTGSPVRVYVQVKSSDGTVMQEASTDYSQGRFVWTASKSDDTFYYGSNTYNIVAEYSDGKTVSKQISIYLHESGGEMAKPVIYLYPASETEVSVKVRPAKKISKSDPAYGSGWRVTARPDGTLVSIADGKTYPYLFWEAPEDDQPLFNEGFVVKRSDLPAFFDKKLSYMGMNATEIRDFKEFWIPLMDKGDYYCIRFYSQEEIERAAPLEITPKPDTVIRIYFESKPVDKGFSVPRQKLKKGKRRGFTVIEWGGRRN